jgi:hypothetical protein
LTEQRWPAFAPLAGVVFVALAVLAFAVSGETPDIKDSPEKILKYYNDHDTRNIWASVFLAWGTVFFFFFLGVLRSALQAAEGGASRLSAVAFGGGLILGVGMLSFAGFTFTLADAADHLTPDAAQALNALNSDFFFPVAVGLGTLLLATALCSIRSRLFPVWLSWITLLIGIAALTPAGFFAFLLFGLWTLMVSVLLWRGAAAPPPAAPAVPGTVTG